jgi:hypothetical protein
MDSFTITRAVYTTVKAADHEQLRCRQIIAATSVCGPHPSPAISSAAGAHACAAGTAAAAAKNIKYNVENRYDHL